MTTLPAPLADLRQYCHQLDLPAGQQLMSRGHIRLLNADALRRLL